MADVAFLIVWFVGAVIARTVMCVRAGLPPVRRLEVLGRGGIGFWYADLLGLKTIFWPITLAVWLLAGRPEPRVVFNEVARMRARQWAERTATMTRLDEGVPGQ